MSRNSARVHEPTSSVRSVAVELIVVAVPFNVVPVAIWICLTGVVVELPEAAAFAVQDTETISAPSGMLDVSNL